MKKRDVRPEYHETVVENNTRSFKKNQEKYHIIISFHIISVYTVKRCTTSFQPSQFRNQEMIVEVKSMTLKIPCEEDRAPVLQPPDLKKKKTMFSWDMMLVCDG